MLRKQKTRAWLLSLAAVVLLMSNYFVGRAEEPDPRILWVIKELQRIDGFTVHPNGNIFANRDGIIFEIDGKDGKLIRVLPDTLGPYALNSMDISDDGKYLAISRDRIMVFNLIEYKASTIAEGNVVRFLPGTHKIAYKTYGSKDSSIVIYDINNQSRLYIYTEEDIRQIAFSPDGKYFATAGVIEKLNGDFITTLKLWDAQTLKLIKELERFDDEDFQIAKIEFSNDSKMIAFFGDIGLPIYSVTSFTKIKEITNSSLGEEISRFTFLNEDYIGIQSKKTSIIRLSDNHRIDLIEFPFRGFLMESSLNKNILYAGTGYPDKVGSIIAWDLEKVLSKVENPVEQTTIGAEYQKGILLISGIELINNSIQLEIFDISGKLIRQLNIESNGTELRIPIVLAKGTYLINLTDGSKKYSSKFLVTE